MPWWMEKRLLSSLLNDKAALIVGLGNPGKAYEGTRHNFGFVVVRAFAKARGWSWKSSRSLLGDYAEGVIGGKRVVALLPATYMNRSGEAVQCALREYGILPSEIIVVSDDVALSLGVLRVRLQGSCGGHNGLRNIEECLGTQYYTRLRMGIGAPPEGVALDEYVLSEFEKGEKEIVAQAIMAAEEKLALWVQRGEEGNV